MEARPNLVAYEIHEDSDSEDDQPQHKLMVRPCFNETIRDVNLNVVISSIMNKFTTIFMSLPRFPVHSRTSAMGFSILKRKVQTMRNLLLGLSIIVSARETPIHCPLSGIQPPQRPHPMRDQEHYLDRPQR